MSIKVKSVVINGNNISFVLPKGNVTVKVGRTFSMPQSAKFTFPIAPEAESSNGSWFPITRDLKIKDGFRPTVTNGGNQISKVRIYAKVGNPFGTNGQGHQLFRISKLGFCALNINNYIEDFDCVDGTLQSAMSKLVGENLGNGTGIVKLRKAKNNTNTVTTTAQKATGTTGTAEKPSAKTGANTTVKTPRMEISDRVGALQAALNDAGYTDDNGKQLVVDKKGGPITQAVARKAGVDYRTWKVGDPIKPANPTQTTPIGTTPDVTSTQTPSGTTPDVTTQTPAPSTDRTSQPKTQASAKDNVNFWKAVQAEAQKLLPILSARVKQLSGLSRAQARVDRRGQKLLEDNNGANTEWQPTSLTQTIKAPEMKFDLGAYRAAHPEQQAQATQPEQQAQATPGNQYSEEVQRYLLGVLRLPSLDVSANSNLQQLSVAQKTLQKLLSVSGAITVNLKNQEKYLRKGDRASARYDREVQRQQGRGYDVNANNTWTSPTQTISEVQAKLTESKLVNVLTNMILNEGKKKSVREAVMNESKLVDMISESMIRSKYITL